MSKFVIVCMIVVLSITFSVIFWQWMERTVQEGVIMLKLGDGEAAVMYFERASKFGSVRANMHLAEIHAFGHAFGLTIERDRNTAIKYLSCLPKSRLEKSTRYIISRFREGNIQGGIDLEEAFFWENWLQKQLNDLDP